jgi:hypothetical protein
VPNLSPSRTNNLQSPNRPNTNRPEEQIGINKIKNNKNLDINPREILMPQGFSATKEPKKKLRTIIPILIKKHLFEHFYFKI